MGVNDTTAYGKYLAANGPRGFDWRVAAPVAGIAALPAIGALAAGGGASAGAGMASVPGAVGAAAPLGAGTVAGAGSGMGLLDTISRIASIGKIATDSAQGSANQRGTENNQAAQRNALLAQLYGMNQNATMNALTAGSNERMAQRGQALDERKFGLTAPSVRANQSVRGSILQNAQPVSISGLSDKIHVPTISGGLTPALFSQNTRDLGGEMTRKALVDQLAGDTFDPMEKTDFSAGVLPTPKLEDFQKSGLLEKILGGLGLAGSVAGGVGEAAFGSKGFGAGGNGRRYDPSDENGYG